MGGIDELFSGIGNLRFWISVVFVFLGIGSVKKVTFGVGVLASSLGVF